MDLELTPEQEELRSTVRRFLGAQAPISPWVRRMLDDERGTDDSVWKGLCQLGVTGILVPEEQGGSGMGMVEVGLVAMEMGRMVHPGPWLSSAVGAVSVILAAAGPGERQELLPPLAEGSAVGTLALFEAGSRSRWGSPAVRAEKRGTWLLSGTKVLVPDVTAADLLLVYASTPEGTGLFAVEAGAEGLEVLATPSFDGTRRHGSVRLSGTPARRLGGGDATEATAAAVDRMLAAHVADGVGAAEATMEAAVSYAKERVQFGRPIGSFQAVAHLCADMLERVELSRSGALYALWAADAASPAERHRAATMAKAFAGEELAKVAAAAIQVFGGIGFTWEHDAHLYYKRLLSLQQVHGPASEHLEELAAIIL